MVCENLADNTWDNAYHQQPEEKRKGHLEDGVDCNILTWQLDAHMIWVLYVIHDVKLADFAELSCVN